MKGTLILLTTALLFAACAPMEPALPSSDEVRTAIKARNARFMKAFDAKDAEALAECYTADAAILAPNNPPRLGDAVREGIAADLAITSSLSLTTVDVEVVSTDAAMERGTYVAQVMLPGADEATQDSGSYVVYWKKGTDGWRLHWDIWNTDLPPPVPETEQGDQ